MTTKTEGPVPERGRGLEVFGAVVQEERFSLHKLDGCSAIRGKLRGVRRGHRGEREQVGERANQIANNSGEDC